MIRDRYLSIGRSARCKVRLPLRIVSDADFTAVVDASQDYLVSTTMRVPRPEDTHANDRGTEFKSNADGEEGRYTTPLPSSLPLTYSVALIFAGPASANNRYPLIKLSYTDGRPRSRRLQTDEFIFARDRSPTIVYRPIITSTTFFLSFLDIHDSTHKDINMPSDKAIKNYRERKTAILKRSNAIVSLLQFHRLYSDVGACICRNHTWLMRVLMLGDYNFQAHALRLIIMCENDSNANNTSVRGLYIAKLCALLPA